MAKFDLFFNTLLAHEGGFSNNPNDTGGETNLGITLSTWRTYGRDKDLDGDIDVYDLLKITREDAYFLYKKYFWDAVKGDFIKNQNIANILFDMHVNAPSVAVRLMQRILNVDPDNQLGPITLNRINSYPDQAELHDKYKEARRAWYKFRSNYLLSTDPWYFFFFNLGFRGKNSQRTFYSGWINRVNKFPDLKKKLV